MQMISLILIKSRNVNKPKLQLHVLRALERCLRSRMSSMQRELQLELHAQAGRDTAAVVDGRERWTISMLRMEAGVRRSSSMAASNRVTVR